MLMTRQNKGILVAIRFAFAEPHGGIYRAEADSKHLHGRRTIARPYVPEPKKKRYRIVAISLFDNEAAETDRIADILRAGGWKKANRSFVVRQALSCLLDDLANKNPEQVFQYFLGRIRRSPPP